MPKSKKSRNSKNSKENEQLPIGAVITRPGSSVKNKTGSWKEFRPVRDEKKCIRCGFCWMFCPDNAINEKFEADLDYCKGCGICANECPVKCIAMVKEEK
ncbi:pyruvate synthase [Candidatus Woesearchaeota archaeon CG10_big_fil_rev_8_21_14_0_10_44_13]|nr:MAG: pyruvate synthase [Candidatus Woesearchaeota archaeon CG10_big_fil_rev_8_21_14_0_10_44_13]